jgi:predicted enzyme related to lactoylglutathione lyase
LPDSQSALLLAAILAVLEVGEDSMESSNVSAVLFAKDLRKVSAFYSGVLELTPTSSDEHHTCLNCRGFDLIIHQIPKHIADGISIQQPPERRVWGALRLNFPVRSVEDSRRAARSFGGEVDDTPPEWAGQSANFFLGYDPEGNVFGVTQTGS